MKLIRLKTETEVDESMPRIYKMLKIFAINLGIAIISFLVMVFGEDVINALFGEKPPENSMSYIIIFALIILSMGGVIQIKRRESISFIKIETGNKAIIMGAIWVIICMIPITLLVLNIIFGSP